MEEVHQGGRTSAQHGLHHSRAQTATSLSLGLDAMTLETNNIDERRPRQLLDLPVDILKDIVKEMTHTNDLTSLALCHSALHSLAIPHIYSRFDIVWPDSAASPEPRTGVDALTYGLGTLVMAEDVFGSRRNQSLDQRARRRRGNYYAHFTRKFSLGNGPPEWVSDYLITKEGGKMLGTLVALAVARMRNLESFVWDMPTGILSAVFDALGSLYDRDDGIPCRLDRIAVRWHNNFVEPRIVPTRIPQRRSDAPPPLSALDHVEHPSFSILPPIKSLSVLDIDEVQYLDEMSVLVRRSLDKLRELRVGVALHATHRDFVAVWDGEHVHQIDKNNPESSCITIGEKRLGGILGVLTGLVFDLRSVHPQALPPNRLRRRSNATIGIQQTSTVQDGLENLAGPPSPTVMMPDAIEGSEITSPDTVIREGASSSDDSSSEDVEHVQATPKSSESESESSSLEPSASDTHDERSSSLPPSLSPVDSNLPIVPADEDLPPSSQKLSLEVLELEQVPLSIPVLQNAIDWERLTTLTLLRCPNHEHLWKILRRVYSPNSSSAKQHYVSSTSQASPTLPHKVVETNVQYKLNLRKIQTDTVSSSLISFIRDTLAPNSLESVFLLQASPYTSTVSIDSIFRGVIRRHRTSLRKILIDSGERGAESLPEANTYWRRWMLNRDMLKFLASGKMPALKELGVALDYRDWHYFLQHLPSMPQIRSLYIPFIVNFSHGSLADTRELALQIVDIIALRPEIELCYIGLVKKCFEILEQRRSQAGTDRGSHESINNGDVSGSEDENAEDDDVDDDEGVTDDEHHDDESQDSDSDETDSDYDSDSDDVESIYEKGATRLRLREILYYDDKVSIFKARHGRL